MVSGTYWCAVGASRSSGITGGKRPMRLTPPQRTYAIHALDQQLPEAIIVARILDVITPHDAPLDKRLQIASEVNYEVRQIAIA
jgi:hypothetical protein